MHLNPFRFWHWPQVDLHYYFCLFGGLFPQALELVCYSCNLYILATLLQSIILLFNAVLQAFIMPDNLLASLGLEGFLI